MFYIKKNFCDGWDNMFSLVIVNAVFIVPVAGLMALLLTALYSGAQAFFFLFLFLFSVIVNTASLSFTPCAAKAADFSGFHIKDCLTSIPRNIKDGVLLGTITTFLFIVVRVCVPFYFARQSIFGAAIGILFLWLCLFVVLSLQWFTAVSALLPGAFTKRLKKCFILFFDNSLFSVFLCVYTLLLFCISFIFFGLLPSVSGITLAKVNALRLRLYKYDYLDAHPEYTSKNDRKIIPWDSLLKEDKEALGPRTFKSFIFPWKE